MIYGSGLKSYTCLKLFDQLIKPICLYETEIWGPNELSLLTGNTNEKIVTALDKTICKKHIFPFQNTFWGFRKKPQTLQLEGNWKGFH